MPNKINISNNIGIYTFIGSNENASITFPEKSEIATGLPLATLVRNEAQFAAIRKNTKEIPKQAYRNGIIHESSLEAKLLNGKLSVNPGDYFANGNTYYLPINKTEEKATPLSGLGHLINSGYTGDLENTFFFEGAYKQGKFSELMMSLYSRSKKNITNLITAKESQKYDFINNNIEGYQYTSFIYPNGEDYVDSYQNHVAIIQNDINSYWKNVSQILEPVYSVTILSSYASPSLAGSNAVFNVTVKANGTYTVSISNGGSNYGADSGKQITIPGSIIGGADGTNDLTLTMYSYPNMMSGGAIWNVTSIAGTSNPAEATTILENQNLTYLKFNFESQAEIEASINFTEMKSETLHYYGEFLGRSKGLKNETYRTKFFPISSPIEQPFSDDIFQQGKTTIFTRNRLTKEVNFYYAVSSYTAAEAINGFLAGPGPEPGPVIALDRYNGKVYFGRESLKKPVASPTEIVTDGLNYLSFYDEDGLDLFDDNGFVWITFSPLGEQESILPSPAYFTKVGKNKIALSSTTAYPGPTQGTITLNPYTKVPVLNENDEVFAYYGTCLSAEKELTSGPEEHLSSDIKPWRWKSQKTIAVLSTDRKRPYKILLKAIDVNYLRRGENTNSYVYGPIYAQQELVLLEGTVYDETDTPLSETEVTVKLASGEGKINGMSSSSFITDSEGKFYATYDPNSNIVPWIIFKEENINRIGYSTELVVPASVPNISTDSEQKAIIYTILKDDGTIGTTGRTIDIDPDKYTSLGISTRIGKIINPSSISTKANAFGYTKGIVIPDSLMDRESKEYIQSKMYIYSINGLGVERTDSVRVKDVINLPEAWSVDEDEPDYNGLISRRQNTYCFILEDYPSFNVLPDLEIETIFSGRVIKEVRLIKAADIEFNSDDMNGRKAIITMNKNTDVWKHPASPNAEIVLGPVLTDGYYSSSKKYYINVPLPVSSSTDYKNPIAGYAILPERTAKIVAFCEDEGDIVYSNTVEFDIEINNRDKGVISNLLNTIKVPYGWRLKDNYTEDSSTIGVNTFFTVNRIPSSSQENPKLPLISYVSANGINYLGYENYDVPAYENGSFSVKFKIEIN